MSTSRVRRHLNALVAAAGAVAATLLFAAPAHAADSINVSVGLASSTTAGGRPSSMRVTLQNRTNDDIAPIRRVLLIRLAGLSPSSIQVLRGSQPLQTQAGGAGEVMAVDTLQVSLGPQGKARSSVRDEYTIRVDTTAPNGRATVIVQAQVDGRVMGSGSATTTVKGGSGVPSASASVSAKASGPAVSVVPPTGASFGPLPQEQGAAAATAAAAATGLPVVYYFLGAILVAVGGAILWQLLRKRPELAGGADDPDSPGEVSYGLYEYPQPSGDRSPLDATTVLPTVRQAPPPTVIGPGLPRHTPARHERGADVAPPPSDPWADHGPPDVPR